MERFNIWWERHKVKVITFIVFCIICILSFFAVYFFNTMKAKADSLSDDLKEVNEEGFKPLKNTEIENSTKETNTLLIKVDVKGAVKNPGVYELDNNKRVVDAIKKAGGILNDADTSVINLSMKLKDEMVIIVYNKQETINLDETKKIFEEKQGNCDNKIINDACIKNNSIEKNVDNKNNKININTATKDELTTITGIGESKANAIIDYRNKNGNFKSIEDIINVNGIGQTIFDKIKEKITI